MSLTALFGPKAAQLFWKTFGADTGHPSAPDAPHVLAKFICPD